MGLDQYVYAETGRGFWRKQACVAYWRKNYGLSGWIVGRLSAGERRAYEAEPCAFSHRINAREVMELAADEYLLAERLGVDWHDVWRMKEALKEGFRLVYFSSS